MTRLCSHTTHCFGSGAILTPHAADSMEGCAYPGCRFVTGEAGKALQHAFAFGRMLMGVAELPSEHALLCDPS